MELSKKEKILRLVDACRDLGWDMVIPDVDLLKDDDEIPGMVIGNMEYIQKVLDVLPTPDAPTKETIH